MKTTTLPSTMGGDAESPHMAGGAALLPHGRGGRVLPVGGDLDAADGTVAQGAAEFGAVAGAERDAGRRGVWSRDEQLLRREEHLFGRRRPAEAEGRFQATVD